MICQEDHDQILADPNATTDELRSIIAELQAELAAYAKAEPVAEIVSDDTTYDIRMLDLTYLRNGTKLFTHPAINAAK